MHDVRIKWRIAAILNYFQVFETEQFASLWLTSTIFNFKIRSDKLSRVVVVFSLLTMMLRQRLSLTYSVDLHCTSCILMRDLGALSQCYSPTTNRT